MKYIGLFLNKLFELTGNLGIAVFILAIIIDIFSLITRYCLLKNNLIKNKYAKEVYIIKQNNKNPEDQLEKIQEIYNKENYSYILPIVLQILLTIINVLIFTTILNYKNYIVNISTAGPQSFLFMEDILIPQTNILIPLFCGLISFLCNNIFKIKYMKLKDFFIEIILNTFLVISFILYSNLFGSIYLIFILGIYISKPLFLFIFYKMNKQLAIYQSKYKIFLEETKKNTN